MTGESRWVQAVGPLATAHLLWRSRGQLHVTILAKTTFAIVPGGIMTVLPPEPIADGDVHHHDDPAQSVRVTSDLVPYLSRADVLFTGFAHAVRGPVASMTVRLATLRDGHPLIDKSLQIVGDQHDGHPRPFQVMGLGWERAYGGIGSAENPLGTGLGSSRRRPNIVSMIDPEQTAGFGPIARAFPVRARLLAAGLHSWQATAPAAVDAMATEVIEVPEGFDWAYFQSAPPDQQTSHLRGDEVVVLEGLHPTLEQVESRLPGLCVLGRLSGFRPGDPAWHALALRADTLRIDGVEQRVSITWRGTVPLSDASRLDALRVQLLSSRAAETAWWPDWDDEEGATQGGFGGAPTRHLTPVPRVERKTPGAGDTMVLEGEGGRTRRELGAARTVLIVDEPTVDADLAVVDLDLDLVLSERPRPPTIVGAPSVAVPSAALPSVALPSVAMPSSAAAGSVEPPTLPRGEATVAPRIEREALRGVRSIPVVADPELTATSLAWRWEGHPGVFRTVVIKAVADLVHGGAALLRNEAPELRAEDETIGDDARAVVRLPGDIAPVKPRSDVVLVGHARVPEGATNAARGEVRFAFGSTSAAPSARAPEEGGGFDRRVRVFGDRVWRDIVGELLPGQPEKFSSIPLSWDRAFGGPGWDANPAGVGFVQGRGAPPRMPNLEWPERPIVHPRDKVKAACFAPIPAWWPARASLRGKSDDVYQHAPPEQRLDVVEGDEPYVIEGAHPTLRRIEGTLPASRVRCFAVTEREALQEVRLRLDAVTFDADDLSVELVWRGLLEVDGPEARDVVAFFARLEALDEEPASLEACAEHYRRVVAG